MTKIFKTKKQNIDPYYSVILANEKTPCVKHIGRSDTLKGARKIKEGKKLLNGQRIWICKYTNGMLTESF